VAVLAAGVENDDLWSGGQIEMVAGPEAASGQPPAANRDCHAQRT
jgi:hypothetical protein